MHTRNQVLHQCLLETPRNLRNECVCHIGQASDIKGNVSSPYGFVIYSLGWIGVDLSTNLKDRYMYSCMGFVHQCKGSLGLVNDPFLIDWSLISSSASGSYPTASGRYQLRVHLMRQPSSSYVIFISWSRCMYSRLFGCGTFGVSRLELADVLGY